MGGRAPLTLDEKERIYTGHLAGHTLAELAAEVGCSVACVRKWWRQGRDRGRLSYQQTRCGRGKRGVLSRFELDVAETALAHKQQHPRWGPLRVLVEMQADPSLAEKRLPSRSRLADLFKARCPECVGGRHHRPPPVPRPLPATGVHEVWQLDCQEGIRLRDGSAATICTIRDPVGAAIIGCQAFAAKPGHLQRKLSPEEQRQVLRAAFAEWHLIPDAVQTDNEAGLSGGSADDYPGLLTLWLVGLGIQHRLIRPHCPTDQAQIERTHWTLECFALSGRALENVDSLQLALDRERKQHNTRFPSRASDCAGQPPLTAHPELLHPRRPYRPECELALFDLQRVYERLAGCTLQRKVSCCGQVSLGGLFYRVGQDYRRQIITVRFDAKDRRWTFHLPSGEEIGRRAIRGIDTETITGLRPSDLAPTEPIQLSMPCFIV